MSPLGRNTLAVAAGVLFGTLVAAFLDGDFQIYFCLGAGAVMGLLFGIGSGLFFAAGVAATAAVSWFIVFHGTFEVGLYALAPAALFGTLIMFVTSVAVGLTGTLRKLFVRLSKDHRQ
jgi:hypothetical protein